MGNVYSQPGLKVTALFVVNSCSKKKEIICMLVDWKASSCRTTTIKVGGCQ